MDFELNKIKLITDNNRSRYVYKVNENAEEILSSGKISAEVFDSISIYQILTATKHPLLEDEYSSKINDGIYDINLFVPVYVAADIIPYGESAKPKSGPIPYRVKRPNDHI